MQQSSLPRRQALVNGNFERISYGQDKSYGPGQIVYAIFLPVGFAIAALAAPRNLYPLCAARDGHAMVGKPAATQVVA